MVYHVQQATEDIKNSFSKDKFVQEEVLIPAAEAEKKVKENFANKKVKMMMMENKKKIIKIREQYEESLEEWWSGLKGMAYHLQPATEEMKNLLQRTSSSGRKV